MPNRREHINGQLLHQVRTLARKMLRQYPNVRRWDETDDVTNMAAVRVCKALEKVEITSDRHYFRLLAQNIRWVLLELARKHGGPRGLGTNHDTWHGNEAEVLPAHATDEVQLSRWNDFHRAVEDLPPNTKEVFDLLWYSGLSKDEAAEVLSISKRTLMNRWRDARITLSRKMDSESPPTEY